MKQHSKSLVYLLFECISCFCFIFFIMIFFLLFFIQGFFLKSSLQEVTGMNSDTAHIMLCHAALYKYCHSWVFNCYHIVYVGIICRGCVHHSRSEVGVVDYTLSAMLVLIKKVVRNRLSGQQYCEILRVFCLLFRHFFFIT